MKSPMTGKERAMVIKSMLQGTITIVRTPFVQRLIILIFSTLLAISMSATILLLLSHVGHEVARVPGAISLLGVSGGGGWMHHPY